MSDSGKTESDRSASSRGQATELRFELVIPPPVVRGPSIQQIGLKPNRRQAEALRRLRDGVRGQELSTGRLAESPADAVRFVLDRIADAMDRAAEGAR